MEQLKFPKIWLKMMKSLRCLRVWNDGLFFFSQALSVSCPCSLKVSFFCVAAERREMKRKEGKLLEAAREGDISTLSNMVWEHLCHSLEPKTHRCGWFSIASWQILPHQCCFCVFFAISSKKRKLQIFTARTLWGIPHYTVQPTGGRSNAS